MDFNHLSAVIDTVFGTPTISGKAGFLAAAISIFSAILGIHLTLHNIQTMAAIVASCVAILSGSLAITYYVLSIRKLIKK